MAGPGWAAVDRFGQDRRARKVKDYEGERGFGRPEEPGSGPDLIGLACQKGSGSTGSGQSWNARMAKESVV
jgi:hypothetical protein